MGSDVAVGGADSVCTPGCHGYFDHPKPPLAFNPWSPVRATPVVDVPPAPTTAPAVGVAGHMPADHSPGIAPGFTTCCAPDCPNGPEGARYTIRRGDPADGDVVAVLDLDDTTGATVVAVLDVLLTHLELHRHGPLLWTAKRQLRLAAERIKDNMARCDTPAVRCQDMPTHRVGDTFEVQRFSDGGWSTLHYAQFDRNWLFGELPPGSLIPGWHINTLRAHKCEDPRWIAFIAFVEEGLGSWHPSVCRVVTP
jgi:hypothetical protein